tara:strand:- start:713 stop:1171 length:459 start_codon:yes stop_codon:yes gene_type:complete
MLSRILSFGFNNTPIARFLNLKMSFRLVKNNTECTDKKTYESIIKMKYTPDINNFVKGNINGGIYSLLIDNAAGFASMVNRNKPQFVVTNNLNVNYFHTASEGELVAIGKIIKQGKKIDVCEASVYNNNIEIARGSGNFFITNDIPKKYLQS